MNVYFGAFSGVAFDLLCIETETWRNPLPPQHRVILNEDHTCSYENRGMVYLLFNFTRLIKSHN